MAEDIPAGACGGSKLAAHPAATVRSQPTGTSKMTEHDSEHFSGWQGRRVLVTGHTGFKGGWLCLWLRHLGAEVTGYALEPVGPRNLFTAAGVADAARSVIGDLRDAAFLAATLAEAKPEVVFHLAAQPLVRASYRQPAETYATNVMGTVHLLDAVRATPSVQAVVVVTTDKCYENREWLWPYRENDPLGGRDPYASSKACAELVTEAYRSSFLAASGVQVASVRAGNVIGGGDFAEDRLIPDLIRGAEREQSVPIRAPRAIRPWQHVLDPLAGYLILASRLLAEDGAEFAEGWNFGPAADDARTVAWVTEQLVARWDRIRWTNDDQGNHPHEAGLLTLDSSKAIARLGWRPQLSLELALDWLIDWYRADADRADVHALTLAQIARYEALNRGGGSPAETKHVETQ